MGVSAAGVNAVGVSAVGVSADADADADADVGVVADMVAGASGLGCGHSCVQLLSSVSCVQLSSV